MNAIQSSGNTALGKTCKIPILAELTLYRGQTTNEHINKRKKTDGDAIMKTKQWSDRVWNKSSLMILEH